MSFTRNLKEEVSDKEESGKMLSAYQDPRHLSRRATELQARSDAGQREASRNINKRIIESLRREKKSEGRK